MKAENLLAIAGMIVLTACGASCTTRSRPRVVLYDDFDDGNYDGWSVQDPRGYNDPPASPRIVQIASDPDNYAIAAKGTGESQVFYPVTIDDGLQVCVEMRAKATRTTAVWLCRGVDFYQMQNYGERDWAYMNKHVDNAEANLVTHHIATDPEEFHLLAFSRDREGWWSLTLDGILVKKNFARDTSLTSFDGVSLMLRPMGMDEGAMIDWVRVSILE